MKKKVLAIANLILTYGLVFWLAPLLAMMFLPGFGKENYFTLVLNYHLAVLETLAFVAIVGAMVYLSLKTLFNKGNK